MSKDAGLDYMGAKLTEARATIKELCGALEITLDNNLGVEDAPWFEMVYAILERGREALGE